MTPEKMTPEGPCCAHLLVRWTTEDLPNGYTRGWWECRDCHTKFVPEVLAAYRATQEEPDRELVEHAEWIKSHYAMMAEKQTTPADQQMKAFYLGQVTAAESLIAFAHDLMKERNVKS